MPATIITLIHTAQAGFSAYNLYLAYNAIRNLQTYEEKSKQAAKYSNIAADLLHKTQTTQASGIIAVLISFLSSVYFAAFGTGLAMELMAGANIIVLEMARRHVGGVWKRKAKLPIPGMGKHNDATGKTQEVRLNMAYLMASWVSVGILGLFYL